MAPYVALYGLIILGGLLLSYFQNKTPNPALKQRMKLVYCLGIGVVLISLCGLRHIAVGFADNEGYMNMFYAQHDYTLSMAVDSFIHPENYDYQTRDLTFHLVNVLIAQFFNHHQYSFFFWAIVSFSGFIWLIYRFSPYPALSFLLLCSLGHFTFTLSGMRQAAALGVSCFAFKYILERRMVKFLLLIVFSAMLHKSAIVFLPAYWLSFRVSRKTIIAYVLMALFLYAFSGLVLRVFQSLGGFDSRVENLVYNTNKLTAWGFIIHTAVFLFCLVYYKQTLDKYPRLTLCYNYLAISSLGLLYDVLRYSIFFRMVMYYSIFEVILVALTIDTIKDVRQRALYIVGISACCVFYFFQGIETSAFYPYLFFWEDVMSI
ncbi:MAG: EpsG family protein [Planctomycetia bacterium]|nr:EpsG family protein [Planctomycetia bacterium]